MVIIDPCFISRHFLENVNPKIQLIPRGKSGKVVWKELKLILSWGKGLQSRYQSIQTLLSH